MLKTSGRLLDETGNPIRVQELNTYRQAPTSWVVMTDVIFTTCMLLLILLISARSLMIMIEM